ncbi:hypothetical protein FSARC_1741 [Fusarium sarcochroum]|uniref:Uncharacterized protein n=1 Tax=Fusarium sarcochroum TaxID=1208366 RepID=A0A8H4XDT1_9HYPO|nr:hypothetical protein FSARC_1741 [Fusarium sarcochroum]
MRPFPNVSQAVSNKFEDLQVSVNQTVSNNFGTLQTSTNQVVSTKFGTLHASIDQAVSNKFEDLRLSVNQTLSNRLEALEVRATSLERTASDVKDSFEANTSATNNKLWVLGNKMQGIGSQLSQSASVFQQFAQDTPQLLMETSRVIRATKDQTEMLETYVLDQCHNLDNLGEVTQAMHQDIQQSLAEPRFTPGVTYFADDGMAMEVIHYERIVVVWIQTLLKSGLKGVSKNAGQSASILVVPTSEQEVVELK